MSDRPDDPPTEDADFWSPDPNRTQPLPLSKSKQADEPVIEPTEAGTRPKISSDDVTLPDVEPVEPPLEEILFEPASQPVVVPVPHAPWSSREPPRTLTFKRRRYATLSAVADALIPPGGVIAESAGDVGVAERIDAAAATFDTAVRKRVSKLLWFWEWQSVLSRALRPFSRLPVPVAVGVVDRASRSRWMPRRQTLELLKTFCFNQWASTPQVEQQAGFTYSCVSRDEPRDAPPLEVLEYPEISRDHYEECDVVVIGSGAGGAVVAKELAEVGLSVIVLEEGGHFTRKDFAGPPWERLRRLYRAQGTTLALGSPTIPLPLGKAVGGTTLVGSGTCFRTPDRVLRRWEDEHGIEGIDPDTMRPYFERVERILHVKPVPQELLGRNAQLFHRGAQTLGAEGAPAMRSIDGCRGCGVCDFGCPSDAKQSTHISYLPRAQRHGATIYAHCRARRIVVEGGRARGVDAVLMDPRTKEERATLRVRSKIVVVAAGAVHTPSLLSANALSGGSGLLGRNLRVHPAATVAAVMPEDVYSWRGTLQPYYVDEWHESHDLMVEVTSLTPGVSARVFPGTGAEVKDMVAHARNVAAASVFVSDTSAGRVRRWGNGEPLVTYSLNTVDTRKLVSGIAHVAEVFLAAGATHVITGLPGVATVSGKADLDRVREHAVRPRALRLTAFHPVGTARMGSDPAASVVDGWGQTHDVAGLFVADASVLPGCPTVNPMVTIMAFATRTADQLARHGSRFFG